MATTQTQAPASTGSDSGGILGGLGKMFGGANLKKGGLIAALAVGVMLLFGFDDPMFLMMGALIGGLFGSGAAGSLFSGAKNLLGGLFGGKSENQPQQQQQPQVARNQGQNRQQAQQQASQMQNQPSGPQGPQDVQSTEQVSPTFTPYNYDPVNHKGIG